MQKPRFCTKEPATCAFAVFLYPLWLDSTTPVVTFFFFFKYMPFVCCLAKFLHFTAFFLSLYDSPGVSHRTSPTVTLLPVAHEKLVHSKVKLLCAALTALCQVC